MAEKTPQRRMARLLLGLVLMCAGSFVAWKSQDLSTGIAWRRLLAGLGGMIAMYGLMGVLGSGLLGIITVLCGLSFFFWSLWTVYTGAGHMDIATAQILPSEHLMPSLRSAGGCEPQTPHWLPCSTDIPHHPCTLAQGALPNSLPVPLCDWLPANAQPFLQVLFLEIRPFLLLM